jgi:hypothetical protein
MIHPRRWPFPDRSPAGGWPTDCLDRVTQVDHEFAPLPAGQVGHRPRVEGRRGERGGDPGRGSIAAGREPADVENPGNR